MVISQKTSMRIEADTGKERNSHNLFVFETSKAPIPCASPSPAGGLQDSGNGLKLNFLSLEPAGDWPLSGENLSGAKDSKDVTLCNNDIMPNPSSYQGSANKTKEDGYDIEV
jgi:hypothetical protein